MPPRSKDKAKTFEQSMARLEETIALVEEGRRLVAASRALLEQAELRINQLDVAPQPVAAASPKDADNDFSLI